MTTDNINKPIPTNLGQLTTDDLIFIIGEKEVNNLATDRQLTTDDLIFIIGKKEVDALQSRKQIFKLNSQSKLNKTQITGLTESNNQSTSELKNKDDIIESLNSQLTELKDSELKNKDDTIESLNSQLTELKDDVNKKQIELTNSVKVITTLKQKIYNLRNQVDNNIDGKLFDEN